MTRVCWLFALILTITACSVQGNSDFAGAEATVTPIPTAPSVARARYVVQRGDVSIMLEFQGRWLPRDQQRLAFATSGQVRSVGVRRGDTIRAGDVLADLDITALENRLRNEEIALETAQLNLNGGVEGDAASIADLELAVSNARLTLQSAQNNSPWPALSNAQVAVADAQRNLDNAQRDYDDAISRPVTTSGSAADSVNAARERLDSAQSALQQAQNNYAAAAANFRNWELDVARAENDLLVAEETLRLAREGAGVVDPVLVQNLRSAELAVEQTRAEIAAGTLIAPIDGVVLEVNIRPGDSVDAFQTVIVIGNPEPKEVIANLAFGDANQLSAGQVGICQVANQPQTAVGCIVRYVPLTANETDQTVRIAATLPDVSEGQLIQVFMPLQTSQDTLWIAPEAVRQFQDRTFVILETPEGPRQVPVTIGLRTSSRVEILSGVAEGDIVLGE